MPNTNWQKFYLKKSFDFAIEELVEDFSPLLEEMSASFGGVLHSSPSECEAHIMLTRPVTDKFG